MNETFKNAFIKRAAEHGVTKVAAEELMKIAALDGAFSVDNAAQVRGDDEKLKGMKYNRSEHFGHYALNPFVSGPLTEMYTRLHRRLHASRAGVDGWGPAAGDAVVGGALGALGSPLSLVSMAMGGEKNRQGARNIGEKYLDKAQYFSK